MSLNSQQGISSYFIFKTGKFSRGRGLESTARSELTALHLSDRVMVTRSDVGEETLPQFLEEVPQGNASTEDDPTGTSDLAQIRHRDILCC